jgi:hypothetical protein
LQVEFGDGVWKCCFEDTQFDIFWGVEKEKKKKEKNKAKTMKNWYKKKKKMHGLG